LNLRAGEWVEVRSADEILASLDETCALDGLPFMPEMLPYCGKTFRVQKSAHKTCDTIELYVIRRMANAVHLEELRCDGSGHDGCQAKCLIFWNEAWLKRVDRRSGDSAQPGSPAEASTPPSASGAEILRRASRVQGGAGTGETVYRCQATDMLKATTNVRRRERWDPRFYLKDLSSGNVSLGSFLLYGARAASNAFTRRWFNWRYPPVRGLAEGKTPTCNLNMQPGELVQVRSKEEIMRTLSPQQRNRGLWFDIEMVGYCNSTFRVLDRVEKIVDEKTGRMVTLPNPCLILDGVVCTGHNSVDRMFCPRAIYPYWREVWLKRVDGGTVPESRA
jgi:hypothetical protein